MKLSDSKISKTQRVVILGISGTGKSTLAAELAEHGFRLTWFNVENASATLRKLSPEAQDRIELIDIPDTASYPIAAETLLKVFKTGKGNICWKHGKDDCAVCKKDSPESFTKVDFSTLTEKDIVVVDTGTQVSNSILAYTTKNQPVEYKPERDDWGALRKYTEFFKSQWQGAAYNLIVVCHCTEAELENGVKKLVPQFGSAAMSANFASGFDHVIYCEVKNGKHRAYSKSTALSGVVTRSRSDFSIEDIERPSLLPIFTGDFKPSNSIRSQEQKDKGTPGQQAVTNLADLAKSLMKGTK